MLNNNYYDIAMNDLGYLHIGINSEYYNPMVIMCQQISEKLLKSVVELCCTDDKLMKSHNLRQLNSALLAVGIDLGLDAPDLSYLKDFYFDARYPGDNFVEVTKQEFNKVLEIMYTIIKAVNNFRRDRELSINDCNIKYPEDTNPFADALNKMHGR